MAVPTKSEIIVKRLAGIFNVPLELSTSGITCELPGWTLSDFTRTGKLGLWNISRLMEVNRLFRFDTGRTSGFKDEKVRTSDGATLIGVVGAQKTNMSRKINELAGFLCPMLYTMKIGYIGNTSFSILVELRHKETDIILATNERQIIFIDTQTRKSHAIPSHMEKLKGRHPSTGFQVQVPAKPDNPSKFYTTSTKIGASDVDNLNHGNQSMYYRFTLDAAHEAARNGFLKNFTQDVCEYDVREFHGKHASETFAGDEINVYVWEDESDKLVLHFEIRKVKNNAPVMYQTIWFYPLVESKL